MLIVTNVPKQCCAIAVYAMCYSIINPCGYWTSGTLSALVSNRNTLYNVMCVKYATTAFFLACFE